MLSSALLLKHSSAGGEQALKERENSSYDGKPVAAASMDVWRRHTSAAQLKSRTQDGPFRAEIRYVADSIL
uniref:Uncharacterized protein n=1 Tax=Steinernema glaseri TaxID=37863 RepID=A0A1I7ZJQ0_9BILA